MKSVFSFKDYRAFLRDHYEQKKRMESGFSYKKFSEVAGLNSPNYLALVIEGQRNLTVTNIHQFARALSLRDDEREYFEALVLANQARDEEEAAFYQRRAKRLRKSKPQTIEKRAADSAVRRWYHAGVLVLAHGKTREKALASTKEHLGLSTSVANRCLDELLRLGLLAVNEENLLQISSQQVTFHDPISLSRFQENFLAEQIELSRVAFRKTYAKREGKFLSHTLTVPDGIIPELQRRFTAFFEDLTAEMDRAVSPGNEKVAQINLQLFHPRDWIQV